MANLSLQSVFECLLVDAKQSFQRRLLVIAGEQQWGRQQLKSLAIASRFNRQLHISDDALLDESGDDNSDESSEDNSDEKNITRLSRKQTQQVLGSEYDCLVYDAYSGLDPDGIAAASGTVVGGGLVILLSPELEQWHNFLDPDYHRLLVHPFRDDQLEHLFIRRFAATIKNSTATAIVSQANGVSVCPSSTDPVVVGEAMVEGDYCQTLDQREAVDAVIKVVKGHRRRPLVLTADRGRGKSSALGIAAAELMAGGAKKIIITAPRLSSIQPVFDHAGVLLDDAKFDAGRLAHKEGVLQFMPPDQLLRQLPKADLLFVDEAAAIPLSLLESLLQHYSRIVFSSTVHGYEGSGRGFGIRFQTILDERAPQWKKLTLKKAIRWRDNDPVEQWLFDALLLDADYSVEFESTISAKDCDYIEFERRDLLADEHLLKQVFALLVIAHYQTTPADLRNLLDGPNIRVWGVLHNKRLVATALVTDEGGFDKKLSAAIWKGERRLRGHLIPQTLASHSGIELAPKLRYQRVMRIAVQPSLQQQGIGQALLAAISLKAEQSDVDILGSSFGVTPDVLHFWQRAGFTPVRLGVTRDACSGTHSALVLKSFNLSGELILDMVRYRFLEHFPHQLMTLFSSLVPELASGLMLGNDLDDVFIIDEQDWSDITAFAEGYRVYEVCTVPLWKLAGCFMGQLEVKQWLSDEQRDLLVYLLLQNRPMPWIAAKLGYTGRKELIAALRGAIKLLTQRQIFLRPTSIH